MYKLVYPRKKKILFICHGNICRSPMAEFVMKELVKKAGREREFQIAGAGITYLFGGSYEEIGYTIVSTLGNFVKDDLEATIRSMGCIGRVGMKETDEEILNIMTDKVDV